MLSSTFLHPQEFTCTQVSVLCILNNTGYLLEGWFFFFFECMCVCGLNESHPDRCDAVSACGFGLFRFVTAHSLLCWSCLHAASLPGFFACHCVSPAPAPPAACLPSWHVQAAPSPIHTLLTTFYLRADETSSSLSLNIDDF